MIGLVSTANAATDMTTVGSVLKPIIDNVLDPIIMLMFAVGLVVFVYGVVQMIWNATDAEAHKKGRWAIFGGVIGMFIMLSAWGIVNMISNTVGGI